MFLRLGLIAFGGPAAHVAMLEEEVVERRGWIGRRHFLDLVGATNLIPGPNSTEMTMHVGYERGGWRGLVVAGASFILPAVLITGVLAWLYVRFGAVPEVEPVLAGIQPAVLGVIAAALVRLGRQAVESWRTAAIGAATVAAVLAGAGEVATLAVAGVVGTLLIRVASSAGAASLLLPFLAPTRSAATTVPGAEAGGVARALGLAVPALAAPTAGAAGAAAAAAGVPLWKLGLFFLQVGAVLYGSGYVLIAFLEGGLVGDYGWLTQAQLLDAVAIGQFTPGPVLSTATFVGYVVAGVPGAVVATAAIFLPSFLFVAALNPLIPRLRQWSWTAAFLDAVNAAAVGLMLAVTLDLGAGVLRSWLAASIAAAALVLAVRFRVNAAWLVLGGALAGAVAGYL